MAATSTTNLKQRIITPEGQTTTTTTNNKNGSTINHKRDKRTAMAKRGLRSLIIAVSFPLSITLLSIYISSSLSFSNHNNQVITASKKPFWFPPSWAIHLSLPASSFFMGLSAWMVWADGGFHRNPNAFFIYLLQLLFTVLWDPFVFGVGATSFGLLICFGIFGSMFGCLRVFEKVNPIASTLIKPCLAWIAFLSIVNLKLVFT
jgi:benzodiazapine receptor